jgi:hypothetical protein
MRLPLRQCSNISVQRQLQPLMRTIAVAAALLRESRANRQMHLIVVAKSFCSLRNALGKRTTYLSLRPVSTIFRSRRKGNSIL